MRKKHLKLTKDQKARGIIYSSELKPGDSCLHEIHQDDPRKWERIELLKDDSFFNNSPYKYNEVRS